MSARGSPSEQRGRGPDGHHVILLARDAVGYANLCRLVTDAHVIGERGDPSVAAEQICAHPQGLIALVGSDSPAGKSATAGRMKAAQRAIEPFREAFGKRLYVGVLA